MANTKYNIASVITLITKIPFVSKVYEVKSGNFSIEGNVDINFERLGEEVLSFKFEIYQSYPLKAYDTESIRFINENLIKFNHVMKNGEICIHTSHNTKFEDKILIDFESLREWIETYYLNSHDDQHYEHIIVKEGKMFDKYYSYYFTQCEGVFTSGNYGFVSISSIGSGSFNDTLIQNCFVQSFKSFDNKYEFACQWSKIYKSVSLQHEGLYYFMDSAPAYYGKFAYKNWQDLSPYISTDFLNFLHKFQSDFKTKNSLVIPLFFGYKINNEDIHWQVAMLEIGKFPLQGIPIIVEGKKTGNWKSKLTDLDICWAFTRDCSYELFFGRGTFANTLINKKILIIGVGAVGSIIAQTLTRGGCRTITIADHDIKEPENVCRSEYFFSRGITEKTTELSDILTQISPFIEVAVADKYYFEFLIKGLYTDKSKTSEIVNNLNQFDLIFDCTTDNDLMYVLDSLKLDCELLNISITNHASAMVCAFYPNIYKFVKNQFSNVLQNDSTNLYNPTGCWNSTFKASYNDINALVQLALKHLNKLEKQGQNKNNFVVQESDGMIKIFEF